MRINKSQFVKNSLNTFAVNIIILVASVLTSIITARILGPEGRGQLSLLILIPTLCCSFGQIGIGHAINYYASKIPSTKLIVNSFAISLIISFLLVLLVFIGTNAFEAFFLKAGNVKLLLIMIFSLPFYIFNNLFLSLFQGFYKISIRNLLLVSQSLLGIFLLLVLLIIFDLGLIGALMSIVFALTVIVIWSAYYLSKHIRREEIKIEIPLIKKLLYFGLKSHIGNIMKDLSYRSDILIIAYFLTTADIGCYVIAVTIAEIIWKIPDAVGSVLLPRIGQMDSTSIKSLTPFVCRTIIIPSLFCCLILGFFCRNVIILFFGSDFLPAVPVVLFMLPGILCLSVWKILANDLIAQGFPMKYSLTSAVALIIMILFDLLLIPNLGIIGAAIASTISYFAATAVMIYLYIRISNNPLKLLIFPQRSDYALYKNFFKGV
jgi:O-antigen/teichoic acid export membrane protein